MYLRGFRTFVSSALAAATLALSLVSCDHSPTAPGGRLVVHVTENGTGPAQGKRIEVVGFSSSQTTDANGLAEFVLPVGHHVVRAHDIGTPGPARPFVELSVEVVLAQTARVELNDCQFCR